MLPVAGCSKSDVKETKGDTGVATAKSDPPSNGGVKKYFEGLASYDPDQIEQSIKLAAVGSIAAAYAQYFLDTTNSALDAGQPYDPSSLSKTDGGYKVCGDDGDSKTCVTWTQLESTGGKIASLKVNGQDLSDRISVGDGTKQDAGKLATVEFLGAYQSVQANSMVINFKVVSSGQKVSIGSFEAKYRGPDGRQSVASTADGPTDLDANSSANITLNFEHAKPGGTVTLEIDDENFNTTAAVSIKVR